MPSTLARLVVSLPARQTCGAFIGLLFAGSAAAQHVALKPISSLYMLDGIVVSPISSIAAGPRGEILIIGGPSRLELFLLDSSLRSIARPTQLSAFGARIGAPTAAAFVGPHTIAIFDAQSANVARIRRDSGHWTLVGTASSNLSAFSAACVMNNRLYLMANAGRGVSPDSGIIHEMGDSGARLRSFGRMFGEIPNPAVENGFLLCQPAANLIIVTSRLFPEVRAYTPAGALRWSLRIPNEQPMGFRVEGRAVRFQYPPDSLWDQAIGMCAVSATVLAIQLGRSYGSNQVANFKQIRTVYVSASTGTVIGEQRDLPQVVACNQTKLFTLASRYADTVTVFSYTFR